MRQLQSRGTRILAESPILTVLGEGGYTKKVLQAFEGLTSLQKESYLTLQGHACDFLKDVAKRDLGKSWDNLPELQQQVLSIYTTNT
jgi:uncharacterized protein CbrC (UPF0167 family)